jgi:cytochrome c-type biogenesis protein CcmH
MTREKKEEKLEKKKHLLSSWDALIKYRIKNRTSALWREPIRALFFAFLLPSLFSLFFALPASAEVTKIQRDEVGKELACLCGTCPRRPLDECTCGHAQQQHARIDALLGAGKTKQQVIDAYVADFGKIVLSKPPAEGFGLMAWLMPPFVLVFGFFMVRNVLRTWSQSKPVPIAATGQQSNEKDPYLDKLEQELREREL